MDLALDSMTVGFCLHITHITQIRVIATDGLGQFCQCLLRVGITVEIAIKHVVHTRVPDSGLRNINIDQQWLERLLVEKTFHCIIRIGSRLQNLNAVVL